MYDSRFSMQCDEWIHKTFAPELFDLSDRQEPSLTQQMRARNGIEHEKRVVAKLQEVFGPRFHRISATSIEEQEFQTLAALNQSDVAIVYGSRLGSQSELELGLKPSNKVSKPDLLIRYNEGWIPVDIKSSKANDGTKKPFVWEIQVADLADAENLAIPKFIEGKLNSEHALQLAHYFTHLQVHGFSNRNFYVGIIGIDGEFVLVQDLSAPIYSKESALEMYEADFAIAVDVAARATSRNTDSNLPAPARPIWKSMCGDCEFKEICKAELKSAPGGGHISLLANVTYSTLSKNFPGIESMEEAAVQIDSHDESLRALAVRALSWLEGEPRILPKFDGLDLPEFDIEIDIDLENSQASLFGDSLGEDSTGMDVVFQYGWIRHLRFEDPDWKSAETGVFENFNQTAEAELEVQMGMWNWLQEQVETANSAGHSIGIFHYSPHERTWWRKFADRYAGVSGVPSIHEIENLMEEHFVDLLPYMKRLAVPAMSYSIKDLAPLAGFKWPVDDARGAMATLKFIAAVDSLAEGQLEAQKWLTDYNRGDVQATMALRNWVRKQNL